MTVSFVLIEIDQSCSTLLQGGSNMWKILTFTFFAFFAAQVFANSNDAIKKTIEDQIAAFKLDDFETAFGFATPFLKEKFGSAENFGKMVRNGYPMVWRPSKVIFLGNERYHHGLAQVVQIVDAKGRSHYLRYYMIEFDGMWRIGGVEFLPASDFSV